jgi:hypothetical protein
MRNVKKWHAVALVIMVVSSPWFLDAAGSMTLRGTVLRRHEITIAVEPTCNAMMLSEKMTDVLLATIYERTTCATGYAVTLASEGNTHALAYSLTRSGVIRQVWVSWGSAPGIANQAPLNDTLIITFARRKGPHDRRRRSEAGPDFARHHDARH